MAKRILSQKPMNDPLESSDAGIMDLETIKLLRGSTSFNNRFPPTPEWPDYDYPLPEPPPRSPERLAQPDFVLPPGNPRSGVYVIKNHETGNCKIGCSRNLEPRIKGLRNSIEAHTTVETIIFSHSPRQLEKALHKEFADKCVHGEWFRLTPADLARLTGQGD